MNLAQIGAAGYSYGIGQEEMRTQAESQQKLALEKQQQDMNKLKLFAEKKQIDADQRFEDGMGQLASLVEKNPDMLKDARGMLEQEERVAVNSKNWDKADKITTQIETFDNRKAQMEATAAQREFTNVLATSKKADLENSRRHKESEDAIRDAREQAKIALAAKKSANNMPHVTDTLLTADATRLLNGETASSIVKGMGAHSTDYWNQVKNKAYQMRIDEGDTAEEAGNFVSKANIELKGTTQAYAGLTKIAAGQEKIGNKLVSDIGNLKSLIPSGDLNSIKLLNTPINKLRSSFSSETYAPFRLQAELVANEFERMMVGNGLSIAQLPVTSQENANKILNSNMSIAEMQSIFPTMMNDLQNVIKANEDTKKSILSKFDKKTEIKKTTSGATTSGW